MDTNTDSNGFEYGDSDGGKYDAKQPKFSRPTAGLSQSRSIARKNARGLLHTTTDDERRQLLNLLVTLRPEMLMSAIDGLRVRADELDAPDGNAGAGEESGNDDPSDNKNMDVRSDKKPKDVNSSEQRKWREYYATRATRVLEDLNIHEAQVLLAHLAGDDPERVVKAYVQCGQNGSIQMVGHARVLEVTNAYSMDGYMAARKRNDARSCGGAL